MTQRTKGVVSKIGKGKFDFYVRLQGDDRYFNTKFEPKFGVGSEVGIEYDSKGPNRAQVTNFKIFNNVAKAEAPAASGGGKWDNPDRQDSIVWQHSQDVACRLMNVMALSDALPVAGKSGARFDAILALHDKLTLRAFQDASAPRKSAAYLAGVDEQKQTDTESPVDDEPQDDWNGDGDNDDGDGWDDKWD